MRAKLTTQGALLSSFSSNLKTLSIPSAYTLERSFIVYSFSLKVKQFLKKYGPTLWHLRVGWLWFESFRICPVLIVYKPENKCCVLLHLESRIFWIHGRKCQKCLLEAGVSAVDTKVYLPLSQNISILYRCLLLLAKSADKNNWGSHSMVPVGGINFWHRESCSHH